MKNKFTILGCGSSLGSPWITNNWGNIKKKDLKNVRTRCCAHFQYKNLSVLIDTSPDIKKQVLDNKIKNIDSVIYTHDHADQTSGLFELKPFFWNNKKLIEVYGSKKTILSLKTKFDYIFKKTKGYSPIAKSKIINKEFILKKENSFLKLRSFEVEHGKINSTAYIFKKIAYISDCSKIFKKDFSFLKNLEYLIIDCFRYDKYPTHLNFEDSIKLSKFLKPKKTILTNLHTDLDYYKIKKDLPSNIVPAFDGMSFTF